MIATPIIKPYGLAKVQLVSSIMFGVLATIVIFLRTIVRCQHNTFGRDDMLMLIGYVLFCGLIGVSCQATYYGMGTHDNELPDEILPYGRQFVWLFQIFFCASLVFIKASICDALLRIAIVPWHRAVAWATLLLSAASALMVFISLFVLCRPLPATWTGQGKCAPASALAILACFVSASSLITDVVCAALPGFMLYKTQMKTATKISITIVLGLGATASVAVIIRMHYVLFYFHPEKDYLYQVCHVALWCVFETGIGVIAGSLPSLRKLTKRWVNFGSSASHSSGATPYASSSATGVINKIQTTSRPQRFRTVMGAGKDATSKDHNEWERLDDDKSSKRRIYVTADIEMHSIEHTATYTGSHDSIQALTSRV